MHFYDQPDIKILFDRLNDIGEVSNIAKQNPETHKKLFDEMMGYLQNVGARIPKVNPDYDLEIYKQDRSTAERLMWGAFEGKRPLEEDEI